MKQRKNQQVAPRIQVKAKANNSQWLVIAVLAALLAFGLALYAPTSLALDDRYRDAPTAGAMAIDAVVVRPMGLVSTVLGTGLFIVTLPFSALGGNVDEAAQALVVAPAEMTFVRPLGEFDSD